MSAQSNAPAAKLPATRHLAKLSAMLSGDTKAEVFTIEGRAAFLIQPPSLSSQGATSWLWYAPTLPDLPGKEEAWMFDRFLAAGIAIAGIDVGESYGSPRGRKLYSAFYKELTEKRGFSQRAAMLARSRGGLMLYNWAAEHPESVACIAGIYPVCNLLSWPGLAKAQKAYAMTPTKLRQSLSAHNPIDRLAALAERKVPIFHIHGDQDSVVPLAQNSLVLHQRYTALNGPMQLRTIKGQGHNMWQGWFQNQELVDFIIEHGKTSTGGTKGIIDLQAQQRPGDAQVLVSDQGSQLIPEKPDGPNLWVFEGGVLTASPKWDSVITKDSYRDFRMHLEFNVNSVAGPKTESHGNSGIYIQQRYELQILDSYGVAAAEYKASYCGSLYRLKKPDRLANKPAGEWQSYDIVFRAARYEGQRKAENARITAYQNGILIHDDFAIPRKTGAGQQEGPESRPIKIQGHHNKVRFREVWIQALDLDGGRERALAVPEQKTLKR